MLQADAFANSPRLIIQRYASFNYPKLGLEPVVTTDLILNGIE
jgi:hypothetical protein